eukprot:TRINITY_DN489_c0_g1_i3.p1 TRINITY_DN489_c0_g1~~TRINITY_DN489_c0_g1_i3.p1  ORF type:complete len:305 (+),score=43.80 TRINITY_DN489_c0_g1_i3:70-984(+)
MMRALVLVFLGYDVQSAPSDDWQTFCTTDRACAQSVFSAVGNWTRAAQASGCFNSKLYACVPDGCSEQSFISNMSLCGDVVSNPTCSQLDHGLLCEVCRNSCNESAIIRTLMCGPNATEEEGGENETEGGGENETEGGGENETEGGGENETAVEEGAWDSLGDFLCSNNSDSGRLCGEIFVSEGEILEEGEINDTSCSSTTGNAVKTMGCCMEGYIRRAKAMGELPQDMALSLSAVVEKCGNPTKCSAPTTTSASIRASTTAASIRASTAAASIPTSTTAASIPTSTTAASNCCFYSDINDCCF